MTDNMTEQMHGHLAKELPCALYDALAHYRKFLKRQYKEPIDFKKHQEACKAAISHIEALTKLAQSVDETLPTDSEDHEDLSAAIKSAMEEVARYEQAREGGENV